MGRQQAPAGIPIKLENAFGRECLLFMVMLAAAKFEACGVTSASNFVSKLAPDSTRFPSFASLLATFKNPKNIDE